MLEVAYLVRGFNQAARLLLLMVVMLLLGRQLRGCHVINCHDLVSWKGQRNGKGKHMNKMLSWVVILNK